MSRRAAAPYSDPYLCGVALGLVLLAAFVLMGRGIGASGAFASAASGVVASVAPAAASSNGYFAGYLGGEGPWRNWLLFEVAGVLVGGFFSAWAAGRLNARVDCGPRMGAGARVAAAFVGGGVMGVGAMLARGCTSGLALTGGALLSVGSWIFIAAAFAAGFAVAPFVKRAWR
jgi:uncharacterized membrane protein YedE/YeeE